MSFNIFGPASKNDIRVGYISTERGFVDGVSVCQANDYAKKYPGTQFVFRTRDEIQYLNINEVNVLTPDNLLPNSSNDCSGIQLETNCGPSEVYFYGGGGIGAKANPIIGQDGSLLAVDLVAGGFGYQYAPVTVVKDNCGIGAGVVVRSVIGEVVETVEYYDQEDDFEDYQICEPTESGYGKLYSVEGQDIGVWDPTLYANFSKDPIRREIQEYQKFLTTLRGGARVNSSDNTIKRWWTTRTEVPLSVTSLTRTTRVKHDVKHPGWGQNTPGEWNFDDIADSFMNRHAISPVPPSDVSGTDFAGITFTMEWEKEFPYDGEYTFRGMADNLAKIYLDNQLLFSTSEFRKDHPPDKLKKTITEGVHRIRVDLYNIPITEKAIIQEPNGLVDVNFNVFGQGKRTETLKFSFISEDGSHSFLLKGNKKSKESRNETIKVKPNVKYKVTAIATGGDVEQGIVKNGKKNKEGGVGTSNKIFADYIASANDNNDMQITSSSGTFESKNKRTANSGRSTYDLTFLLDESSNITSSSTESQKVSRVFNTVDYIQKADRQLWRCNVYGRGGFINEYGISPFDTTVELKDNPYAGTHRIVWDNVDFPVDGNYNIEIEVDDSVVLTFQGSGGEIVIEKNGFNNSGQSTGKSLETRAFTRGKYKIIADLEQIPGGVFAFSGIKGSNPMALAINIESSGVVEEVISPKSWNENPMGTALVIDAPLPPVPQEPIVQQEGRCPNNPIWTTRFPGSANKWIPVRFDPTRWSQFMNRYAISPILPLSQVDSDGGGIIYRNSWKLDIPYDGFYALKGTVDNGGRILIDGREVARGGGLSFRRVAGSNVGLDGFSTENPKTNKIFLTKGMHSIEVEIENEKTQLFTKIEQKVFDTKDWVVSQTSSAATTASDVKAKFVKNGSGFYLDVTGNGSAEITFIMDVNDNPYLFGMAAKEVLIPTDDKSISLKRDVTKQEDSAKGTGKFTAGKLYGPIEIIGASAGTRGPIINSSNRLGIRDDDGDDENIKITISNIGNAQITSQTTGGGLSSGTKKGGVSYTGPTLASYRNGTLGPFLTPAFTDDKDYRANNMDKTWTLRWDNVDFPVDGQYTLKAEADDYVIVRLDGIEIGKAEVFQGVRTFNFNTTKGKRQIEMEIYNIPGNNESTFETNPIVFAASITVPVNKASGTSRSWLENPIGISAILIPPPCPKIVRGKGVITEVIVDDPGNGNPSLPNNVPPATVSTYPVTLRLKSVIVENPGINHNCGVDEIQITPSNGAVLSYDCDSFGRIRSVNVLNPGLGFTSYPDITMVTDTGVNAKFRPQFEVVRDPIVEDTAKLIQVTDLVGLKQTGYVDGRAYFGAVFYKDGIRYAGFYETPGELVQVYDTLQESIDAQVVTRPSAILRQGTDTNSNNPRLNIPGTPENLI